MTTDCLPHQVRLMTSDDLPSELSASTQLEARASAVSGASGHSGSTLATQPRSRSGFTSRTGFTSETIMDEALSLLGTYGRMLIEHECLPDCI